MCNRLGGKSMNRQFSGILILCIIWVLSVFSVAHAYIDPGTGGFIIQTLLAALFSFIFVLKSYWTRIKNWFSGKSSEPVANESSSEVKPDGKDSEKTSEPPHEA